MTTKNMEKDGRLKLKGTITDFSIWDDITHEFALKFHRKFNVYPNIFLASEYTLRKIDLYAQMHHERITGPDLKGIETSSYPYTGISHFSTPDYCLEFCYEYDLAEGKIILIFDENPDFSGEPIPDFEKSKEVCHIKKTA